MAVDSDWLKEQWPRYHDRIHELEDEVIKLKSDLEATAEKTKYIRKDFDGHKAQIFGNGNLGYVDRRIKENSEELQVRFVGLVKDAVRDGFVEYKKEVQDNDQKTRDKWDARSWALVIVVLGWILSVVRDYVMAYIK